LAERARPAGFAAADILRIEAGFILFANELSLRVTPAELGLASFADPSASNRGDALTLVAFTAETASRPVLWQNAAPPMHSGRPDEIFVTSACWSPLANATLGLGYVQRASGSYSTSLRDPSGEFDDIRLVGRPFFDPEKRRPRKPWR
jgi:glycine cleavage system aminomethyltransferase T